MNEVKCIGEGHATSESQKFSKFLKAIRVIEGSCIIMVSQKI